MSTDPGTPYGIKTRLMVGMEIHVELNTRSKMWTSAPNVAHPDYVDAEPNTLLDGVVMGMPGTLPVMNKAALEKSVLVGLALNCAIAPRAKWDRKAYWYPDLPKSYQISQYDRPICGEGWMEIPTEAGPKKIRLERAHLEEDAGKLMHDSPGGGAIAHSIVDLNRAGTPLLEIVTKPDFATAAEAVTFSKMLRDLCRHLGVTEGVMQQGHMRFEPNINVIIEKDGVVYKTPIVEVKNLNSFRAVEGAILHEHQRQVEQWVKDGKVMGSRSKSTRGWDDVKMATIPQREKEDADEYRYFPDPDLVEVEVGEAWLAEIRAQLTEAPHLKKARWVAAGLDEKDAESLLEEPGVTRFFESVVKAGAQAQAAAKFLRNTAAKLANTEGRAIDRLGATPAQVGGILSLLAENKVGSGNAEKLLAACCAAPGVDAAEVADKAGFIQVSDSGAIEALVDQILGDPANAKAVADLRAGNMKAVGALMGQAKKLSGGKADAKAVQEMIAKRIG